jgi:hypothetical protein
VPLRLGASASLSVPILCARSRPLVRSAALPLPCSRFGVALLSDRSGNSSARQVPGRIAKPPKGSALAREAGRNLPPETKQPASNEADGLSRSL